MRWGWLIGAAVAAVAALSVWFAFQSPEFVAGLTAIAVGAAWKALAPKVAQRMTPDEEAAWHAAVRRGQGDEWLRKWHRRKRRKGLGKD